MAKKSKAELTVEKLDGYILGNFRKIPHFELHNGIKSILSEYRNFKGINPALILILTIFRYKKIDFFKTFNTVDEIEKYFQGILTNYCIKTQISVAQIPNEMKEKIKEYYYKNNPEVKKFDDLLLFYLKNEFTDDEDVREILKIKKDEIQEMIEQNIEILNKSILIRGTLNKVEI